MKKKTFKFIHTDSHGYLVVSIALFRSYLKKSGPDQHKQFVYSFVACKNVYLEEDQDASLFLDWLQKQGYETYMVEVNQKDIKKDCRISGNRDYIMSVIV